LFGFRGNGGTLTDIVESLFVTLTQRLAHYNASYFDVANSHRRTTTRTGSLAGTASGRFS